MSTSVALEIVGDLPKTPLLVVPGDTLARVDVLERYLKDVPIDSANIAGEAAELLEEAIGLSNGIEAKRVELKAPFLEFERKIDAAARAPSRRLAATIESLRRKLSDWQSEQVRRAEEAERQRQAELARLEAERFKAEQERIRLEEETEAQRSAPVSTVSKPQAELPLDEVPVDLDEDEPPSPETPEREDPRALRPPAAEDDFSDLAAGQAQEKAARLAHQQEALEARAVAAPVTPSNVTWRTTLKFQILDVRLLPDKYVERIPNEPAIRRDFCTGWTERMPIPQVSGVRFYVDKQTILNSRR
jgi:hypothetical protein